MNTFTSGRFSPPPPVKWGLRLLAAVVMFGSMAGVARGQVTNSSSNSSHKLIVCQGGTVQGWGFNGYGELGFDPASVPDISIPQTIPGLNGIVAVEVGSGNSYAIRQDGKLLAWGANDYGQLGLGYVSSSPNAYVYTPTVVPNIPPVVAVAAQGRFVVALCGNGTVYTWGENANGSLGNGTNVDSSSPVLINLTGIVAISCGEGHCFARTGSGRAYAWGANNLGMLGLGSNVTVQSTPALIPGLFNLRQIEASNISSIAVTQAGAVYCWGSQQYGLVGNGNTGMVGQYNPQIVNGIPPAVAVASSLTVNMAILANGATWVWGNNNDGLFGICSPAQSATPTPGHTFTAGVNIVGTGYIFTSIEPNGMPSGVVKAWGTGVCYTPAPATTSASGGSCLPTAINSCPAQPNMWPTCPALTVTPSFSGALCSAGASVTLTASGGFGQPYVWSPNTGLTPIQGTTASVIAAPGVTTTYTVTSGCQTGSITVDVNGGDCCILNQVAGSQLVTLKPKPYVYTTSPFTGPRGTYYYVNGSLRIENTNCTLPRGSVLLVGNGITSNVELGPNAGLTIEGATITAACDEMWGGLIVEGNANSITAYTHTFQSHLSHSYRGIVLEEAAVGTVAPRFQIDGVDFSHNHQSVEVHRFNVPSTSKDYISSCAFDSDPELFKKPWDFNGPDGPHYSLRHIAVAGDTRASDISGNNFQHSLYGVYGLLGDNYQSAVKLSANTFSEFYIAGVFNTNGSSIKYGNYQLDGNVFTFPPAATLPAIPGIPQFVQEVNDFNTAHTSIDGIDGVAGVFLHATNLVAVDNKFQQLDSASVDLSNYDLFPTSRPHQIGIFTANYSDITVVNNSFYLLVIGLNCQRMYPNGQYTVQGNGFTHCRTGIILQPQTPSAGYPGLDALTTVNLSCNTFRRVDNQRPGKTIGVYIGYAENYYAHGAPCPVSVNCPSGFGAAPGGVYYPPLLIDDPAAVALGAPNTTYMKNLFDDSGNAGTYYAFVNDQATRLEYKTYGTLGSQPGTVDFALHDFNASVGARNFSMGNDGPNTVSGTETCNRLPIPLPAGIQLRGVSRHGPGAPQPIASSLAQNWPNPTTGLTTFVYQLKSGTQKAELQIHRATDGREVQRVALDVRRTSQDLTVKAWPKGTYFVTLLVDEVPCATKRLVAE